MSGAPRRRIVAAGLGLVAIGLAASACGGDAAAVSASLGSPPRPAPEVTTELPPDVSIPDITIPEGVPGADDLQQCVDLTEAYAQVAVLALSGDDEGQLPSLFDQLEAAAPADLQDDLAVIRSTTIEAAQGGLLDATGALLDQEYVDANTAVIDWLSGTCTGEGG